MRNSTGFRLAALCLMAASIQVFCSQASAGPKPAPKKVLIQEEFKGYGLTLKEAQAHALERACDWMTAHANFGWSPSPDYLREKGMVHFVGEPNEKEFDIAKEFAKDGKLKDVTMQLEITEAQARDIQKQAQNVRMKERQKYSLLGLLGAVALLGVVGGYLRLEEATKGYFTRRLLIAAIAILLVTVAGLCVIA
jgi:hypothetical protein